jgi:hypothetical protein
MVSTPEQPTSALSVFDEAYATRTAPWVIGEPQPAIVTLEREGWVRGTVLDVGCGTGEHTIISARWAMTSTAWIPRPGQSSRPAPTPRPATSRFTSRSPMRSLWAMARLRHRHRQRVVPHFRRRRPRPVCAQSALRLPVGARVHVLALSDTGPGFGPPRSARHSANDGYWRTCALHSIEAQPSATSTREHFTAGSASSLTYPHG